MPYEIRQWPKTVYPDELLDECSEAAAIVDVFISEMRRQGPMPLGYSVKNLGGDLDGLWQLNLKVRGRQIRILYAPYKDIITLFRIHKKSSTQEQNRAYRLAKKRKREYEEIMKLEVQKSHEATRIIH